MDNSMFPENERVNPINLTPEQEAQHDYANQQWMLGRYCIGCQAVGVDTNALGYCASCDAAYDTSWQKLNNQ